MGFLSDLPLTAWDSRRTSLSLHGIPVGPPEYFGFSNPYKLVPPGKSQAPRRRRGARRAAGVVARGGDGRRSRQPGDAAGRAAHLPPPDRRRPRPPKAAPDAPADAAPARDLGAVTAPGAPLPSSFFVCIPPSSSFIVFLSLPAFAADARKRRGARRGGSAHRLTPYAQTTSPPHLSRKSATLRLFADAAAVRRRRYSAVACGAVARCGGPA
eukprot:gene12244-biopygen6451